MKKRLFSSFLALCMVLTLLPVAAWAAETPQIIKSISIDGQTIDFTSKAHAGLGTDVFEGEAKAADLIDKLKSSDGLAYSIQFNSELDNDTIEGTAAFLTKTEFENLTMRDFGIFGEFNFLIRPENYMFGETATYSDATDDVVWLFSFTYTPDEVVDPDELPSEYYAITLTQTSTTEPEDTPTYTVWPPSFILGGNVVITVDGVECEVPQADEVIEGAKVVITATPNTDYRMGELTVVNKSTGAVIPDEDTAENTYTFTMPAADVTYNVTFEEDIKEPEPVEYTFTVIYNVGGIVQYGYDGWHSIPSGGSFKVTVPAGSIVEPSVGATPYPGYEIWSIVVNEVDLTSQMYYDIHGNCQAVRITADSSKEVVITFVMSTPVNPGNNNTDNSTDNDTDNSSDNADDSTYVDVAEPSTSGGNTVVGMTTDANTSGTTSKVEVRATDMNKAVDSAVGEAIRQGTAPVLEIRIRTPYHADSLEINLPVSSLEKLADALDSSLTITTNVAEVALDHTALIALVNQATGNTVTLEFAPVGTRSLNIAQREAVGTAPVVDLSLVSGRTAIHDYNDGVITVTLPYTLPFGQAASDVVVYYLEGNGTLNPCSTSYADGKVTFTTSHLSKYVIGDKQLAAKAQKPAFTDVSEAAYYADAVTWAVQNNIAYGVTDTTFGPDVACTRAQIVSFLWRQAGSPKMSGANPFTDVSATDYYYDAVLWAVANGIAYGSTDTTFSPGAACTRAQAMTFLYRDKGSPAAGGSSSFADVSADEYYADAVQWAVANGVAYGITDTAFGPNQDCTRAQIMSFLYRAS